MKGKRIGIDATALECQCGAAFDGATTARATKKFLKVGWPASRGVETPTREDLARVDRNRKKKGSNQEWVHPHDESLSIEWQKTEPRRSCEGDD